MVINFHIKSNEEQKIASVVNVKETTKLTFICLKNV